jgi:hypothetical protein
MSDTEDIAVQQRINDAMLSLQASESLIYFVVACEDSSSDGIIAIQKSVQNIGVVLAELAQLDPSAHTASAVQAKERGEAFLAQHGHSSQ